MRIKFHCHTTKRKNSLPYYSFICKFFLLSLNDNNLMALSSGRLNEHNSNNNNDDDIDSLMSSESKANKKTMKSNHSHADYGMSSDTSSGRFSSALNRLNKYSADYKPLMRTFTRRFESPTKVIFFSYCD